MRIDEFRTLARNVQNAARPVGTHGPCVRSEKGSCVRSENGPCVRFGKAPKQPCHPPVETPLRCVSQTPLRCVSQTPLRCVSPTDGTITNTYHARRTGTHASRKEHRRAAELQLMQRAGLITGLREQVRYELIPAQYATCGDDFKGHTARVLLERPCAYVADFVYRDSHGRLVVEDTKGVRTREYIIKRKLMLSVHGIRIKEI